MSKKEENRRRNKARKIRASVFNTLRYCQTPNCTNTNYSNCHVIPEASQLKRIEEDLKVSWIHPTPADILFKNFRIKWSKTQIANVLTFRGFCSNCDSTIFRLIDKPLQLLEEEMPLLAYRAFSYLYWHDNYEAETIKQICTEFSIPLENMPSEKIKDQRVARNRKEEIEYDIQSNSFILNELRDMIEGSNTDLRTIIYRLNVKSDFLYSCSVPLTIGPYMNSVQINWAISKEPPKLYFHLLHVKETTAMIFSWNKKFDEFAIPFAETWKSIPPKELGMTLLTYASFSNMGLAVRNSLLDRIPIEIRNRITREIQRRIKKGNISNGLFNYVNKYSLGEWNIIDEIRYNAST